MRNSDAIIAETTVEKEFYVKHGIKEDLISVISPGLELKNYENKEIGDLKQRLNMANNAPVLFFMGRRSHAKGIFQCIYALHFLIKKYKDIKLLIAGAKTREFEQFYDTMPPELKSHIIDLGFVDEKTKLEAFKCCDIFVLPSLDDAFGVVYLEAWYFKKPVIGAIEGNVKGLIDDQENGLLVSFKKIKILAQKIDHLLSNDEKRKVFGQNGYNKVMNQYLIANFNKKMLSLYRQFI